MARLTVLLGKGGTGRTTLARALARTSSTVRPTTLLHADPTTELVGPARPDLRVRVMDPYEIVEDAMARLLPLGPITRSFVRQPAYRSFLEIAPGVKEAAVLNFVYGLLRRREDHVVLDGPATGHGLHFLEAPGKLERVLAGKLAERMRNVDAMVRDAATTRVVLVALPEELPAVETSELAAELRASGFPLTNLVVNKLPPPVPDSPQGPSTWSALATKLEPEAALHLLAEQRSEAEHWLALLEGLELPVRVVPNMPGREAMADAVAPFVEEIA